MDFGSDLRLPTDFQVEKTGKAEFEYGQYLEVRLKLEDVDRAWLEERFRYWFRPYDEVMTESRSGGALRPRTRVQIIPRATHVYGSGVLAERVRAAVDRGNWFDVAVLIRQLELSQTPTDERPPWVLEQEDRNKERGISAVIDLTEDEPVSYDLTQGDSTLGATIQHHDNPLPLKRVKVEPTTDDDASTGMVITQVVVQAVGHLRLVDASKLATTCRDLRGVHFSLIVKDGNLDFPRLARYMVSDAFVLSVLSHLSSLLSIESAMPRSEIIIINLKPSLITDEAIKAISAHCPSLKELNASFCTITDEAVKTIAAKCPELRDIDVSYCKNLTDYAIKAIATGCPSLTTLDVSYCKNLTDEAIKAIAKLCPALTTLKGT